MPAHDHPHHDEASGPGSFWTTSRAFLVCAGFLIVVLVLLWTQHLAHALGFLPYLLILACPLMHLFMHGVHGRHAHRSRSNRERSQADGGQP